MPKAKLDYQQLSAELATVLSELESGSMEIEAAVKAYERGLSIVKQLEAYLDQAQNTVTTLRAEYQPGGEAESDV